ncbi:MAG: hypothetical protein A2172_02895 [Candidatus Woykebacteria bacterium RBG_13_40_15]|uniref:Glycosyltransferase 2-like domain-containing protein n=1 Tax=Candidatus Woykebacteria bacterium RBG_13_40_15 TaxID=1802593 RepID=A0A1G1W5G2_9BACT|nr:MAG: hypothetical protein A2172_02895 [Candidatus Woykebacteria bacterium RBG_13_40_15]
MSKLSVVILTREKERYLEQVLASLSFADEIILVVDSVRSGSRSEKIGRKYKAKTFLHKFKNYEEQKNFGIEKSSSDWILNLDSDEIVPPELGEEMETVIKSKNYNGYMMPSKNFIGNRWVRFGGLYPDYHIRLFKKTKGEFFGSVHESVKLEGNFSYLKNPVIHYTYASLSDYWAKVKKYSTLEAERDFRDGKKIPWFLYFKIPLRFTKLYFIQLGFLDGFYGFASAAFLSYYLYLKFAKIKSLEKQCA